MPTFENILEQAEQAAEAQNNAPMDITPYFVDYTRDIERPTVVIYDPLNPERIFVSEQNVFTIAGQAKSRKSFLAALLIIDFFKQHPDRKCIMIDTEQAEWNVLQIARRVCRGMGWSYEAAYKSGLFKVAHLRPYTRDIRLQVTEAIIEQERPYLVIIDGARDMVSSVNEDTECSDLIDKFLAWSANYNCAIGTVVHTNKDGETVRGHLGSELVNKSETVFFCEKEGEYTKVSSLYGRNIDFDTFRFGVNEQCVPERKGQPKPELFIEGATAKANKALNVLEKKEASKMIWLADIRRLAGCVQATAEGYFNQYVRNGFLRKCTKDGDFYGHFELYGDAPVQLWPEDKGPELPIKQDDDEPPF